jgi:cell pole-organizing protein PopZ
MEDLLASIRRAIHEDIGDMPASGSGRAHASHVPGAVQPSPRVGDELAAAASEIQMLREKISRARAGKPVPPVEPAQRAASLAAALQAEAPRRNWRELEPPPLPRLRGSVAETEISRQPARVEVPLSRSVARNEVVPPSNMLSGSSAQAVQSAFSKLADSVMTRATSEKSVEDVTRELLRVMLKQWLDENLPAMVERMVREEIERVARTGR